MRKLTYLFVLLALSACDSSGGGKSVSTDAGTTVVTVPTTTGTATVQLSWTASTGNPNGYYVMKSTDGTTFALAGTVIGSTTATVNQLVAGQPYYFKVIAFNSGGNSAASGVFSITP